MFEDLHNMLTDSVTQVLFCKKKREDGDINELLPRFEVFSDDKEITFDKLAKKANAEDCKTKVQLCKGWFMRRRRRE
jgi:hypothetical protein